jgi:hypothetical protein
MKKTLFLSTALLLLLGFSSCKKITHSDVTVNITHSVGSETVTQDTIIYTNAAGNEFSITKLQYIISEIELTDEDGNTFLWDDYIYVDLNDPSTHQFLLSQVPTANYTHFHGHVGLNATLNVTDGLPNTTELNAMAWPDPMGGGYHFMKLEGYYKDANGNPLGYAMHLGRTENIASSTQDISMEFAKETEVINLNFDIMEWHQNPANWDFNTDGTAIMANPTAMAKLSTNGSTVLSFEK